MLILTFRAIIYFSGEVNLFDSPIASILISIAPAFLFSPNWVSFISLTGISPILSWEDMTELKMSRLPLTKVSES